MSVLAVYKKFLIGNDMNCKISLSISNNITSVYAVD